MNVPGIRIAVPSNAADAYGLLKTAIRDNNPTIFCEHKRLYGETTDVEQDSTLPFGKANVLREGSDVTVVSTMYMTRIAQQAAEELAKKGIQVDLIDLRTLKPLDKQTILDSVSKTGRLSWLKRTGELADGETRIVSLVAEQGIYSIKSPVRRVCIEDVPIPFSPKSKKS